MLGGADQAMELWQQAAAAEIWAEGQRQVA
jgi:hypothetical protein